MNTLVVYFSKFGNTQLLAEKISSELDRHGMVHLICSKDLSPEYFKDVDLVVMGTPTHKMNLPKPLQPILESLPRRSLKHVRVAAFDTSYKMSTFLSKFTAAKKLIRVLRKRGGKSIVPPETFHVEGREGPLFPGEIERAKKWAKDIAGLVNGHNRI